MYCYKRRFSVNEMKSLIDACGLRLVRFIPRRNVVDRYPVLDRYYVRLPPFLRGLGGYDHVIAQKVEA